MTGSLVEVGVGRWTGDHFKAALEARDRRACGQVAPAEGLYLTFVGYEGA
jgi:tRNA pseudouridine38-40 synthase